MGVRLLMFLLKTCNIKGICWQCKPATSRCAETEKTPSNKEHHLPSASPATLLQPRLCTSPLPPVCQLWTSATQTPSPQVTWNHKRQPSHHIFIWKNDSDRVLPGLANQACYLLMCYVIKQPKSVFENQISVADWLFWSLTRYKWLTV